MGAGDSLVDLPWFFCLILTGIFFYGFLCGLVSSGCLYCTFIDRLYDVANLSLCFFPIFVGEYCGYLKEVCKCEMVVQF